MKGSSIPTIRAAPGQQVWNITHPEVNRYLKGLLFSPPGHGKTRFLGSANLDPRTYPMILLDYEGGTGSLVGLQPTMDVWKIRDWNDYNQAYAALKSVDNPYKSVGLDSISETHIQALMGQLDSETRAHKIPDLLEQGDYGIALVQMRRLIRSFRDLPLHVFATSLTKDDTDPREGTVKKPALAGALADEAPGIFDFVGYLSIVDVPIVDAAGQPTGAGNETRRVLLLQNYPKFRTKIRVPATLQAPNEIWDPTVTALLDALGFPPAELA